MRLFLTCLDEGRNATCLMFAWLRFMNEGVALLEVFVFVQISIKATIRLSNPHNGNQTEAKFEKGDDIILGCKLVIRRFLWSVRNSKLEKELNMEELNASEITWTLHIWQAEIEL